jgi:hypothetical protein
MPLHVAGGRQPVMMLRWFFEAVLGPRVGGRFNHRGSSNLLIFDTEECRLLAVSERSAFGCSCATTDVHLPLQAGFIRFALVVLVRYLAAHSAKL